MNKTSILIHLLLILFLVGGCKKEDSDPSKKILTNNPLVTDLDNKINDILVPYTQQASTASVSLGIFKDGQTFYYGYGEAKKGTGKIPDSETIYEIGSITKTFTALLMMDFLQSKGLSINIPINNLLPSDIHLLQYNDKSINVKHLLNHTSGLPRLPDDFENGMDINNPYKHYDSTKVYSYLKNFNLQVEPGQTWEYSNLGLGIAGTILERQTHKSYEQLLLEKICVPLGLNKTKLLLSGSDSLNFATGYNTHGLKVQYWDDFQAFKGIGAIRSNAKDLISYGKIILNHESSYLKTQIDSCLKVTYEIDDFKMSSGWLNLKFNGNECLFHDGGTGGFSSFIVISRVKNIVLVVLFNNAPSSITENCFFNLVTEVVQ